MEKYIRPEIEIISVDCKDIIVTSGNLSGGAPDSDDSEFG